MKHHTILLLFCLLGNFIFPTTAIAVGFDLEVDISVPNLNPVIYSNVPVTVTATNAGTEAGTGIQIRVGVCGTDAFSFVQQNEIVFAATGSTNTGTWDYVNQRWMIPNLAPGQTATLTFSLFTLTTDARSIQVFTQAANPTDMDSTPSNLPTGDGVWTCTNNEDDEAVLTLNGGITPCVINASVTNIQCHDNGTPTNATDDKFSFTLTANNLAQSTGYQVFITQTSQIFNGTYGSPLTIQNVPISTGNLSLSLTDNVTAGCSSLLFVSPPEPCSNGGQLPDFNLVSFFAVQPVAGGGSVVVAPNDQVVAGTVLNFPDHFAYLTFPVQVPTFNVAINAYLSTDMTVDASDILIMAGSREINASTQSFGFTEGSLGTGPIPANTPPGNYFLILKYDATNLVAESNESNNTRNIPIEVVSGTSGQIDLELQLIQTNPTPIIYSNYLVTATIKNTGGQTATGVRVSFKKPVGVVYTGSNEWTVSQGSFIPFGNEEWIVGSLPAGGSATLTVSYFLLQNGAPNAYAQVSAANETDIDSSPNNGTPPTPNEDDEAATGTSQPPVLTPDLTISNLVVSNAPIQPGQVLTYNFDLANIGNGSASADFKVKAWISTQPFFNTSGIQDGIVPTGNFSAGFSVSGVPGSSTLPSSLADGQYYLHLWVDAEEVIAESNESNNTVTASFLVVDLPSPGDCDQIIGAGAMVCTSQNGSGDLEVVYQSGNNLSKAILGDMGQIVSNQSIGTASPEVLYFVENGQLKKVIDGSLAYSLTIPAVLSGQYDIFLNFTEYNGGYLIFGYKNANASVYALRTDGSLNALQSAPVAVNSGLFPPLVRSPLQISPSEVAFLLVTNSGQPFNQKVDLYSINNNLLVLNNQLLSANIFSTVATLKSNFCGDFALNILQTLNFCVHGSCYKNIYRNGHFENGEFVNDFTYTISEFSAYGQGSRSQSWQLRTNDGGHLFGTHTQQLPLNPNPPNNVIHLEKIIGGGTVWTKDVTVANAAAGRRLGYAGNELVFLSEKTNAVFVEPLSCLENTTPPSDPCNAVSITPGEGKLTIAGAIAPHVLIKVFYPNWTVAFECLDNCGNPLVVNELNSGAHHVQVKLIDSSWGEICFLEQDISIANVADNGVAASKFKYNRQRLAFDKIYPNPAQYLVTIEMFSKQNQTSTLDFYNTQGRLVHTMEVHLKEGSNEINLNVSEWKSGAYNIIGRGEGEGEIPTFGRFLKVWEE